jgi:hypothetical protein
MIIDHLRLIAFAEAPCIVLCRGPSLLVWGKFDLIESVGRR